MAKSAQGAIKVGVAKDANFEGIEGLKLLNQALQELGCPPASDGGLG
jgi:hypothetical protein